MRYWGLKGRWVERSSLIEAILCSDHERYSAVMVTPNEVLQNEFGAPVNYIAARSNYGFNHNPELFFYLDILESL